MTLAWLKFADAHEVVVWHSEHSAVVWIWVAVLPCALVPLWQLEQVPSTLAWLTVRTGDQALEVWQSSQRLLVEICVADLPVALVPL